MQLRRDETIIIVAVKYFVTYFMLICIILKHSSSHPKSTKFQFSAPQGNFASAVDKTNGQNIVLDFPKLKIRFLFKIVIKLNKRLNEFKAKFSINDKLWDNVYPIARNYIFTLMPLAVETREIFSDKIVQSAKRNLSPRSDSVRITPILNFCILRELPDLCRPTATLQFSKQCCGQFPQFVQFVLCADSQYII